MQAMATIFLTVFLAEFGDKTQLATMLFASEHKLSPFAVFAASGAALVASAAIATFFGTMASRYLEFVPLKLIAGIGFVIIGGWTIVQYYRGA